MKRITLFFIIISLLWIKNAWPQDTILLRLGPEGKYANLWSYHPDNNYGHTSLFHTMGWTYWGEVGAIRSIMDFDLLEIPPDAIIIDAKLSLYYLNTQPDPNIQPGENESNLKLITSAWDEETVTWNNPPLTTSEDQVYLRRSTVPEQNYPDINVTTLISKMFNEPENYHGLMLRLINEDPYACMLFASGDCNSIELRPLLQIIYEVCEEPEAGFGYVSEGLKVNFQDSSHFSDDYYWDFGDGYYSSLINPWHIYDMPGNYLVCLMTWNDCGSDSVCEMIDLSLTAIQEMESGSLVLYPNPACDFVFVRTAANGQVEISLTDLSGKQVLFRRIDVADGETLRLPLGNIEPGLYILRFDSGNSRAYSKLMVIR